MAAEDQEEKIQGQNRSKGRVIFVLFLVCLTATALATGIILNSKLKDNDDDSDAKTARFLLDCHPDKDQSEERCLERGCVWVVRTAAPSCSFPKNYGYKMAGNPEQVANGVKVNLYRTDSPSLMGMEQFQNLTVMAEFHTDHRLRIKLFPTSVDRYEIPEEALNITSPAQAASNETRLYDVTFHNDAVFGFTVTRRSNNVTIFNTSLPGLAYYPQFLQISTLLHNSYLYGFGEHRHETFRLNMTYRKWSIFTRDAGPDNDWNLYGAQPVYMNVEDDGKANMVLLKNSNAMEVYLQPDPIMTFRTIGGILDFYIFLGDSPGQALSQYTEAIGRPVIPPYWALGYQLSRWGYRNITDMKMVVDRNRAAGIPYDVQWGDIDSFYEKCVFTYDRQQWDGLPDLVQDLHDNNQHFVIIVDPGVASNQTLVQEARNNSPGYDMFHDGKTADIFVKDNSGATLMGNVWPGVTAFPDFTNASVLNWYEKYVQFYRESEGVKVDALWIDMNEPANFVPGSVNSCNHSQWDFPPYVPKILGADPEGKMFDKTLCMTAQQAWGRHYDVHSLYGHSMAMRTNQVLRRVFPGKRPWTMTRSSFVGTGKYATKWTGDNQARWPAMHWSIITTMEFGLFGFSFVGADICGFWYETTYELCIRWHQLGAFYPFSRNHNGRGDPPVIFKHQDPGAFDQRFIDIVQQPLMTRYRLLPYLYSLLYSAHLKGDSVFRPMFFDFPRDLKARDIDRQFLLGPALLLSPVLDANATDVEAYFPDSRWFEYSTGGELTPVGQSHTLHTPLEKFNLHVRGGHVIPWQVPSTTTIESRNNSMGLIVALDEFQRAQGELYLDDGVSEVNGKHSHIAFTMKKAGELQIRVTKSDYNPGRLPNIETIEIYGLPSLPQSVQVNGASHDRQNIQFSNKMVHIIDLKLHVLANHTITWHVY